MSLRSKILGLSVSLALIAMIVGVGNYVQSVRALTNLVESKLQSTSENAAGEIENRYRILQSQIGLLAASRAVDGIGTGPRPGTIPSPRIWTSLRQTFLAVEFRTANGEVIERLESDAVVAPAIPCTAATDPVAVRVAYDGVAAGPARFAEVVGWVPATAMLPQEALQVQLGRSGQTLVLERGSGNVLYDARCVTSQTPEQREALGGGALEASFDGARGSYAFVEDGVVRNGWYATVPDLPWAVVSAVEMAEFMGPYARMQLLNLGMVLSFVTLAGGILLLLARHYMRSLDELTEAADRIGEGDLTPWLPPPGTDEVGRLSQALGVMAARLKSMIRQAEAARQMAVVGEVASQLSHEIRNPLSSIKLNLQSLEREARRGSVPSDLEDVLRLCLREITRLDDAVTSVLEFGRPRPFRRQPCRLDAIVDESLDVITPRLSKHGIEVQRERSRVEALVLGDDAQLRGVFLNLFLNAADAMPQGGTLRVWTERVEDVGPAGEYRVHVADSGAGIRPEVRDMIFQPFFTTKSSGSGIGLPTALQSVQAHGGRLYLERRSELERGAEFVVAVPAASADEKREAPEPRSFGSRDRGRGTAVEAAGVAE